MKFQLKYMITNFWKINNSCYFKVHNSWFIVLKKVFKKKKKNLYNIIKLKYKYLTKNINPYFLAHNYMVYILIN
jgi:hypothetical protein